MAGRKKSPRPPDILRKGGPMKDRTKYDRKRKKPPSRERDDEPPAPEGAG